MVFFRENNLYDKAAEAYHQAIKIKPDFPWSHYHLGVVLEKQEKLDEASTYYQNAIQLYPSFILLQKQIISSLINLE